MAIVFDGQGNLVDTENKVQFGNEKFDSEPYEYTPDYLGANSPMLNSEGNAELSSVTDYGYDPSFGQLESQLYGATSYPGSGNTYNYFDDYEKVPSLQRALGNDRFAMAPEQQYSQPQELGFIEPEEAIYQDRIMNRNLPSSSYEPKQGIMQGLQNSIGSGINNIRDFASTNIGRLTGLLSSAAGANIPGMIMSGLGALKNRNPNAPSYQNRTPGFNYNGLNESMINDFYDSNEESDTYGTTRFDRAKTAFGKSRTLKEYFERVRAAKAQKEQVAQEAREQAQADRARAANPGVYASADRQGFTNAQGGFSTSAADRAGTSAGSGQGFSNNSGRGRTGYQDGGIVSLRK